MYKVEKGNVIYKTLGYKKLVIYYGVADFSFRQTANLFNYIVKQDQYNLSAESIKNHVYKESWAIEQAFMKSCHSVSGELTDHNFISIDQDQFDLGLASLKDEIHPSIGESMVGLAHDYETKDKTIYIQIDDICCKEQKSIRKDEDLSLVQKAEQKRKEARTKGNKPYKESRYLFHTITHIIKHDKCFSMVHKKMDSELTCSIAALIRAQQEQDNNLVFLIDGHQSLIKYLNKDFQNSNVKIILDWYHVSKKITNQLTMGVKKSEYREDIEIEIKSYIWHGMADKAIQVLESIKEDKVKDGKSLITIANYLKRNKELLQNYALRKKFNLPNSTSRVEKQNDILVAKRQKRNGMSWSKKGSRGLAMIKALTVNGQVESFYQTSEYKLKWAV